MLLDAAKRDSVIPMKKFHNIFDSTTPVNDRYETLEAASEKIEDPTIAIYSALLSKKDTGLPGDGFFDIFLNCRRSEAISLVGNKYLHQLTDADKQKIAEHERPIVYTNAKNHF